MPELVLASTSPYRRALLSRLGLPFRCAAPLIDENTWKDPQLPPRALAELLARVKGEPLAARAWDGVVVGGDQVVAFEGRIFGKPADAQGAIDQLSALAGRKHELITAIAVWHRGKVYEHTDQTTLWMRPLGSEAIERYIAADRPFDCAGSYKLEERGITLFERIESDDHTAITGLPLIALTTILRALGFDIP